MKLFQINKFVLLDEICKIIKIFKIKGTGCYDINVTCA